MNILRRMVMAVKDAYRHNMFMFFKYDTPLSAKKFRRDTSKSKNDTARLDSFKFTRGENFKNDEEK